MTFRDPQFPLAVRAADLLGRLTLEEKLGLLHQHQQPIPRLGLGPFTTGTEALHGLAWLGEATVFPQAVGLGATWDPDLVRRIGAAVGDEVRVSHHTDGGAGLNVWAPVVNPLRDPRWGRNEEGYSEDAWLTGLLATAYAQGLRGDHPAYLKTAPTLKHFLGYNNENDRCTSSSNLGPRVLHEYELPAYRPAIASGAAVAVMASYNLVNGHPAHVSPLINDELRSWTDDEVFVVSDAYAPSNLADPGQQAYFADHAESHAAALRAGVDSFTDGDDRVQITIDRLTEAYRRGLLTEDDIDRAAYRALLLRLRLGELDPQLDPFRDTVVHEAEHRTLAREAARRSIVLLKRECRLLPWDGATVGRVAVIGPLGDQLMHDWYSGTMPYQVTVREGLTARLGPEQVTFAEGVDRVAVRLVDGGYLAAGPDSGPLARTGQDPHGFDLFDWGGAGNLALRAAGNGRHVTVTEDGSLVNDSPGPHGWEVRETFQIELRADHASVLRHVATGSYVRIDDAGFAVTGATLADAAGFELETRINGAQVAAAAAREADVVLVVLGNHPLINGRETEDRTDLALPRAQEQLLRTVYQANSRIVLLLMSSYPYAATWANTHIPAILWAGHGGQEFGHALAEVLLGEADPTGRLPQTWYRSHCELPDLFDYDIITNDATYLYHRGTPLYPFGHGLSWAEFEYGPIRLSSDTAAPDDTVTISIDIRNIGNVAGHEVAQLYTHQQRSRVKQPLRQLRGFRHIDLAPGEQQTVHFELCAAELWFWDVTTGRMVVETARHKVMIGRSATDIRASAPLSVRGERIALRRPVGTLLRAIDHDDSCGISLVDAAKDRGDATAATEPGAWVSFGATDLTGCQEAVLVAAGGTGTVELRAGDPLDGTVLAVFRTVSSGRYEFRDVAAELSGAGAADLYLVCDRPGIIIRELSFS